MAITPRAEGTWAEYTADGTVAIPAAQVTGDLILILAAWKDYSHTAVISGYTEIAEFADGTTAKGNGTGSMKVGAWYKVAASDTEADPTLDWTTLGTNDIAGAVAIVFQKAATDVWAAPTSTTAGIASATDWTATGAANLNLAAGDVLVGLAGFSDNSATMTRSATTALAATGITWSANYVEYPATHFDTTTGFDMSADAGYRIAASGTSSAAPTATGSLSASETGAFLFIRLAVTPATDAGLASGATTSQAPGTTVAPNMDRADGYGWARATALVWTPTVQQGKEVAGGLASGATTGRTPVASVSVAALPMGGFAYALYDQFNETVGNVRASSHTPDVGGPWVDDATNYPVVNSDQDYLNHQVATVTVYDGWADAGVADATFEFNAIIAGPTDFDSFRAWFRKTTSGLSDLNGLAIRCLASTSSVYTCRLESWTSGAPTTLISDFTLDLNTSYTWKLVASGASLELFVDDVSKGTANDSSWTAETWIGFDGSGASVDQWDAAVYWVKVYTAGASPTATAHQPTIDIGGAPATNAPAEPAPATATAQAPGKTVDAPAGLATASATGQAAGTTVNSPAGVSPATATGQAAGTSVDAPAGLVTGAATSQAPGKTVEPAPAQATATAGSVNPTVSTVTGVAWGAWSTTFSNPLTAATNAPAGLASGAGLAQLPAVTIEPIAAQAAATTTGQAAAATVEPVPTQAAAAATGHDTGKTVETGPTLASAATAGYDPTVTTSAATNAPAEPATVAATGQAPGTAVDATAGLASATATAQPTAMQYVPAELAAATATGIDATITTSAATNAPAGLASNVSTSHDPGKTVDAPAAVAAASATGIDPTVTTSAATNAPAGLASGAATAEVVTASPSPAAGTATGAATGQAPTAHPGLSAGLASTAATGHDTGKTIAPVATQAAASAAAANATGSPAKAVDATQAAAIAAAWGATVVVQPSAMAGVASAVAEAWGATITLAGDKLVYPGAASATAVAWNTPLWIGGPVPFAYAAASGPTGDATAVLPVGTAAAATPPGQAVHGVPAASASHDTP